MTHFLYSVSPPISDSVRREEVNSQQEDLLMGFLSPPLFPGRVSKNSKCRNETLLSLLSIGLPPQWPEGQENQGGVQDLTINVPVVFMARCIMVLRGATSLQGALEGVGPENRDFFGPKKVVMYVM